MAVPGAPNGTGWRLAGGGRVAGSEAGGGRPIGVLLADDHTMFRQGLASVLSGFAGMEVVGQAANDEGVVALARRTRPEVVVMQVQSPFERAKENVRLLRALEPAPKVIVVTMLEDPRRARELVELGATSAYILKSSSTEHLVAAVRAAVLDPEGENVVVGMPKELLERSERGTGGVLSARELEILLLAARGLPNRRIAAALHIAEATVKRHLANVYGKMGVVSRGEAAQKALLEGWITVADVAEEADG